MIYLIIGAAGVAGFITLTSWYMGRQLRRRAEKARPVPLQTPVPLNTSARNVKTTYVGSSYDRAPESPRRRTYEDESDSFTASDVFTTMAAFDNFSSYDSSSSSDSSFSGGGGDFGGGGSDSSY